RPRMGRCPVLTTRGEEAASPLFRKEAYGATRTTTDLTPLAHHPESLRRRGTRIGHCVMDADRRAGVRRRDSAAQPPRGAPRWHRWTVWTYASRPPGSPVVRGLSQKSDVPPLVSGTFARQGRAAHMAPLRPTLQEGCMWKREYHEALTGVDDFVNYTFLI